MHSRPSVTCPPNIVGTPGQFVKLKRGGTGRVSGSGPSGYKTNPAYLLSRSLAERANVAAVVKARQAQRVKEKATPIRLFGSL